MTSTPEMFGTVIALNQADLTGDIFNALPNLPNSVAAGSTITIEFSVQNSGIVASGLFDVDFYISRNNIINPAADRLLGTTSISVDRIDITEGTVTLTLPGATDPFWNGSGNYFLGMVIDPDDVVDESNEGNNSNVALLRDYDVISVVVDDAYEENDGPATAFDLTNQETVRLSNINGLGIQADPDWYEIEITPGFENLVANLEFVHANGDLNLFVFDAAGNLVTSATSVTNNETINTILPSAGTYYLVVGSASGNPTFNTYDLVWDDLLVDDAYEENDSLATAFDLTAQETVRLSDINGLGRQADADWYEIEITPGFENLVATLDFVHANGDLDLFVYNAAGNLVTQSTSTTDDEFINVILPSAGTYYLVVDEFNGASTFNIYDLVWDDLLVDDAYEENDTRLTAFDLTTQEAVRLSDINGSGVHGDQDWYEIEVTPGFENLVVDLFFTHADGNLELAVFDAVGNLVAESTSVTNNESLDILLPSAGTYYLQVDSASGNATFNTYDLIWDDLLYLVGTEARDLLEGTANRDTILGRRGDDDLFGLGGDDLMGGDRGDDDLFGGRGDDFLDGGRGDDVLVGVNSLVNDAGVGEVDYLVGGYGDDVFVLGDSTQVYYNDRIGSTPGIIDYAFIEDFQVGRDVIQLRGGASNYQLSSNLPNVPAGIGILLNTPGQPELIAVVQGAGTLNLNSDSFVYV
ncbi:MAG: T9SS type A sorting domain-containing protein [Synechococcales bacterium]|nr:T9SS type A sorting domain-containing protein [Synechococcales bacterium]